VGAVGEPPQENDALAVVIDEPIHPLPPLLSPHIGSGAANDNAISTDLLQENLSSRFPESKGGTRRMLMGFLKKRKRKRNGKRKGGANHNSQLPRLSHICCRLYHHSTLNPL